MKAQELKKELESIETAEDLETFVSFADDIKADYKYSCHYMTFGDLVLDTGDMVIKDLKTGEEIEIDDYDALMLDDEIENH